MDLLMVVQPTGLWENILFWLESWVGNYAIAIILITLLIKVVMLPFEFLNKHITRKNSIKQAEMKPELDKLKERYGKNPELLNKKTMELYKQKNYKMGGMCGIMLAYMAATMIVFFTLLGSLNTVSYYKMYNEYESVKVAYETTYSEVVASGEIPEGYDSIEAYAKDKAGEKTIEVYGDVKTGFLWIKSIWRPDTSNSPIMDYKTFASNVKHLEGAEVPEEAEYNEVMGALMQSEEYSSWNGYYILCLLAALATFASTYINNLVQKVKARKKQTNFQQGMQETGKGMNIIMPIIMGLFTLFYTASFGLYIVTSSLFSMASGVFVTVLIDKVIDKQVKREKKRVTNTYDRSNLR